MAEKSVRVPIAGAAGRTGRSADLTDTTRRLGYQPRDDARALRP